jgi:hypothetical protein
VVVYSKKTSTATLRRHLFSAHIKDWLAECERLGISITAKEAVEAITAFQGIRPNTQTPRPQFTSERLINALAEFIVATDQVCLKALYLFIFC